MLSFNAINDLVCLKRTFRLKSSFNKFMFKNRVLIAIGQFKSGIVVMKSTKRKQFNAFLFYYNANVYILLRYYLPIIYIYFFVFLLSRIK